MKRVFGIALFLLIAGGSQAADRDPQMFLKEAERRLRSSDTAAALQNLRLCLLDPSSREWMIEEAMKVFTGTFRAPSDSPTASQFFSLALRSPQVSPVVPAILTMMTGYPRLSGEEKLSVLTGLNLGGSAGDHVLDVQIQLLRGLGRHDPALELAARLAQNTGRMDHRVQVVDLMLDLGRSKDAAALAHSILSDVAIDPTAYSMLAERFYRHGDYLNTLQIHRLARSVFANPMLFFDQSLSICQGLQLGREGIELYLPILLENVSPAPEYYRDFISMIPDTAVLTRDYPAWISGGKNPNLFLVAVFRFAEIAPDTACLEFAGLYRNQFQDQAVHLGLAEKLLERGRRPAFLAMLADVPDSPVEVVESKKILLFKNVLLTLGPDRALEQYPPSSFSTPALRASVHRLAAQVFFSRLQLKEAIAALKSAQSFAAEPSDDLRLAQMHFLDGSDSDALDAAYRAHRHVSTDETLYWLGWLSFLRQDTETARKAFRDAILRAETFFADESLAWILAMGPAAKVAPVEIGQAMRDASRGRQAPPDREEAFPVAVRLALRRQALRSGLDAGTIPAAGPPFLQYLRWEALELKDRTEAQYQKLLRDSPEFLRPLIRVEEP